MSTQEEIEHQLREYLQQNRVHDILTKMLEEVCIKRPDDVISHMVNFLQQWRAGRAGRGEGSASNDEAPFTTQMEDWNANSTPADSIQEPMKGRTRRGGISAEPIDPNAALETDFPVIPKSEEERVRLEQALRGNALFSHLEADDLNAVYNAMFFKTYQPGESIITQGEQGDYFYVVDEGKCEVLVSRDGAPAFRVLIVEEGGCFGELALIYGTPRAATVKALTPVRVWAIDRRTYRGILLRQTMDKRTMYQAFLEKVPILAPLEKYERLTVADALQACNFDDGDVIIQQGQPGDAFYIVVEGEVVVTQSAQDGSVRELTRLHSSDFFGEIALLTNQPRAATVTANGPVKCVRLDRNSFNRLLGPCEEILKRNLATYNQYVRF